MADMPYMERVGRKFVSDFQEVMDGLNRIDRLAQVAKPKNREAAEKYLKLYVQQNRPPETMEQWRVLRDGMIKRLRG